jgi:hypothetical protein
LESTDPARRHLEKAVSIQINVGDHVSIIAPLFQPVPFRHQWVTNWARQRAKHIAATLPSADRYFKTLPFGRSLTQLLHDRTIWINYAPSLKGYWGATDRQIHKEIGITPTSYLWGRWTVLATLIHELAHTNGAPGENSRAAEDAVLHCGLGRRSELSSKSDDPRTPYDPLADG